MELLIKVVGAVVVALTLLAGVACVLSLPTYFLVNYLFNEEALFAVFGGPFTVWKALWLNVLCGILFQTTVKSNSK